MVTDPRSGAIRAMVGSPDFNDEALAGQVNLALTYQQPGSAIKPVTYTAALQGVVTEQGPQGYYTPATVLWDVPTTYPDGTLIQNFNSRYSGPVSMRDALQQSLNVPAVKAYAFVGDANFQATAQAMGLRFQENATFGLPTGVGATEVRLFDMMEAYGTLANNGALSPLYAIDRIEDFNGNPVEYERAQPAEGVPQTVAYLMQDILSDDAARQPQFGPNNNLGRGFPADTVAAKTGTSNGARDLWTMGFTRNAVVGVWLGTVDNRPTTGSTTGYLAASPVWRRVMDSIIQVSPPQPFQPPSGVVQDRYCSVTGTQVSQTIPCPGGIDTEIFIASQLPPPAEDGFVREVTIDTWTGQLYDPNLCPENNRTVLAANIGDPTAIAWLNTDPTGQQFAQSIGLPVPLLEAPTEVCGTGTTILQASISAPGDGVTVTEVQIPIEGFINAGNSFSSYNIQVASAASPENFQIVTDTFMQPPVSNQLGVWDATNVQNGQYIIRLAINSTSGGYAYRTKTITLQKPLPTATPTVPAIPTTPPLVMPTSPAGGATPLPFDDATPLPFGSSQGEDFSP
jgi:hypothetical protein